MILPLVLLLALPRASLPGPAPLHANSISVTRLEVDGRRLRHELELQTLSVLEVLPDLDRDGDGELDPAELEDGRLPLAAYLDGHYALRVDRSAAEPLRLPVTEIRESAAGDGSNLFVLQRIALVRELELPRAPEELRVDVSIFADTSPDHRDFCTLAWAGQHEVEWLFAPATPRLQYEPDPELARRVLLDALTDGALRALGFAVLGLLAALFAACPSAPAARRSAGLFLLGVLVGGLLARLPAPAPPSRLLELAALLAVAYSSAETLLAGKSRLPWIEALAFGAVHGAGLVVALGPTLAHAPLPVRSLAGNALGFTAGVLLPSVLLPPLLARLPGRRDEGGSLVPIRARRALCGILALAGLVWFVRLAWFASGSG